MDHFTEACGFSLYNEEDARKIEDETKKINYLKSKMNFEKPQSILRFYEKALEGKTFSTPAGLFFMAEVREFLTKNPATKDMPISPIPLSLTYNEGMPGPKQKIEHVKPIPKKMSVALPCSLILNCLLILAMIIMFFVTLNSSNPNIINYERAITDKYSAWEADLDAREDALREKELNSIKEEH